MAKPIHPVVPVTRNPPTTRYVVTATIREDGKPYQLITFDERTVEEAKVRLKRMGFRDIRVDSGPVGGV